MKPLGIIARTEDGRQAGQSQVRSRQVPTAHQLANARQARSQRECTCPAPALFRFSFSCCQTSQTRQVQASAGKCRAREQGSEPHQPEQAVEVDQKWSFDNKNMGPVYLLLLFPRHICTVFKHLYAEVKYSANP